jgi:hypothetical protein
MIFNERCQRICVACSSYFFPNGLYQDVCEVCAVAPKARSRELARHDAENQTAQFPQDHFDPSKRQMLRDLLRSRCPSEAEWAYESMLLGAALREEAEEALAVALLSRCGTRGDYEE